MKKLQQVKIKDILSNDRRFLFLKDPQKIYAVFAEIPLLWKRSEGYIPVTPLPAEVSGNEISALVYPVGISYEQILMEQYERLCALTDIHAFDIAGLLGLLERYEPAYDKHIWSRRLKIGPEQIPDYLTLTAYQSEWEQYFRNKNVPFKRILAFSDDSIRDVLSRLLEYNPGINILERISLLLQEIARREKQQISAVWDTDIPQTLFNDKEGKNKTIPEQIRQILYNRRYPLINAYQKRIDKKLRALDIPDCMRISMDTSLETPGISIHIRAQAQTDLENAQKWLDKNHSRLDSLIAVSTLQEADEEDEEGI